jgi:hypothetical protein
VNNDGDPDAFENRIPPFRGLQRLELLRMSHAQYGRDRELADILVSCPNLHDLSLSTADGAMGDDSNLLPKLIQRFASNTEKRLRLRSLRLGYGFLPVKSEPDYLSRLTDLIILETLRLDNDNIGVSTIVRSLQRLFLVGEDNARRYDYRDLELEYNNYEKDTVENDNELAQKLILKVEAVYASHTANFARDFFRNNRQSIAQGDERALLKYIGVGGDVYTCMLLPTGASYELAPFSIEMAGQIWDYHVVKLTNDEAAVFDTIQEWHEGMGRLRVGGDEGTIW